jgi:YMGG-like Gly-zipper
MPKAILVWLAALSLLLSSCATVGKSTVLGAAIGSVVGGSIGALASQHSDPADRTTGVLLGAGFGGVIGGLIGHESYKEQAKKDQLKGFDGNSPGMEIFANGADKDKRPTLRPAQVKVRYVEDAIKEGVFVPAHFEYEISEPARWEKSK